MVFRKFENGRSRLFVITDQFRTLGSGRPITPGKCPEHGSLSALTEPVTLEHLGAEWQLAEGYDIGFCEPCIQRARNQRQYEDAAPVDVIRDKVTSRWREYKSLFELRSRAEFGTPSHCPFCGSSLSKVDDQSIVCPEHGEYGLEVTP